MLLSVLAAHFPRSGDDWAWGSRQGVDQLDKFFAGVNGRYGGNLLILGLTRTNPVVAGIFVSAVVCVSLVLVLRLTDNRAPMGYGLVSALFLAMPLGVWRQSVVWLSGFVNYGVAAMFLLAFLVIAKAERCGPAEGRGAPGRPAAWKFAGTALAGFIGQLFMEPVTLCICVLGIGLSIIGRLRRSGWPALTTTWTAAALVGAIAMFSNSAYRESLAGTAKYQSTGHRSLHQYAVTLLDYLPTQTLVQNLALNAVLFALLLLIIGRQRQRSGRWTRASVAGVASTLVWGVFTLALSLVDRHSGTSEKLRSLAAVDAVLLAGVLLLVGTALLVGRRQRWTLWLLIVSVVLLVGPLLIVTPIGPRNFYPSYLLLIAIANLLLRPAIAAIPMPGARVLVLVSHVAAAALLVAGLVVYVRIDRAAEHRVGEARAAVRAGRHSVVVAPLPYSFHVHDGDPYYSRLQRIYKAFYGLPADFKIKLRPNPWKTLPGKPPPAKP